MSSRHLDREVVADTAVDVVLPAEHHGREDHGDGEEARTASTTRTRSTPGTGTSMRSTT